jgi:hypothetical protein
MLEKAKAPAAAINSDEGGDRNDIGNDEATARKSKRKLGNVCEERHLGRNRSNGSTIFDTWVWTGEPLQRRRT